MNIISFKTKLTFLNIIDLIRRISHRNLYKTVPSPRKGSQGFIKCLLTDDKFLAPLLWKCIKRVVLQSF